MRRRYARDTNARGECTRTTRQRSRRTARMPPVTGTPSNSYESRETGLVPMEGATKDRGRVEEVHRLR